MVAKVQRAGGGRWPTRVVSLALILMAYPSTYAAAPNQWPDEFPWTCTQSSGQIIRLSVESGVYGKPVAASVYIPPCYDWTHGALPVIYLLHGANADETQWPDLGVTAAADALIAQGTPPFVVVMPGGVYLENTDYEDFVLSDLMAGIQGWLRVRADGAGRAIGGISLGAYWALKTAFQHPDQFAAVGGHSPVTIRTDGPNDPAQLAGTATGLDQLHIALDVGDLDSLRASTEQLAGTLRDRGLDVSLNVGRGGHNRPYWRLHTAEYLRFYLEALAPPPPTRRAHYPTFWHNPTLDQLQEIEACHGM